MQKAEAKIFVNKEYPLNIRGRLFPILETAAIAVNSLISDKKPDFFASILFSNIHPKLFTFAINRQFAPDYFPGTIPITSETEIVNNFGYIVPKIRTEHSILYVYKVSPKLPLPHPKYIRKAALNNGFYEEQLVISDLQKPEQLNTDPKCLILTYTSLDKRSINSANLIYPDSETKNIIHSLDLKEEMRLYYENDREEQPQEEKKISRLKEEILEDYYKIAKG